MAKPKCFIIMPITTPEHSLTTYRDDVDHFKHVLEHLFEPAVDAAGYEAIPPAAIGDDLIHGRIISNLESADLVLCDMTSLNANVFFELGVRTALNKPSALVKDGMPIKVPFDIGIINHHEYCGKLQPWTLSDEIEKLVAHLPRADAVPQDNSLWRTFGAQKVAEPHAGAATAADQIGYFNSQIEAVRKDIATLAKERRTRTLFDLSERTNSEAMSDRKKWHSGQVRDHAEKIRGVLLRGDTNPQPRTKLIHYLQSCEVAGVAPEVALEMDTETLNAALRTCGVDPDTRKAF